MSELVWYDDTDSPEAKQNRWSARHFAYVYHYVNADGVPGVVRITRTPGMCSSHPCIDGTRMTVHDLVAYVQIYEKELDCYNSAVERVGEEFPHYGEHIVRAVMSWYEYSPKHKAEIDGILEERERDYEELKSINELKRGR